MVESASPETHELKPVDKAHANLMHEPTASADENLFKERWWIDFELRGDLRFISHHDTLRLFRRALARAALPVRFSQGFNPHPRMTMPLPRPLGVSSEAEVVIVEMDAPVTSEEFLDRLSAVMPTGVVLRETRILEAGMRPQPDQATYRFRPEKPLPSDFIERLQRVDEAETLVVQRENPKTKRMRRIDIRPYLLDIQLADGDIEFTLRITGTGTAKPSEVIELLLPGSGPTNHRIHRQSVRWR